jgi:hypothetical protein
MLEYATSNEVYANSNEGMYGLAVHQPVYTLPAE